MVQAPHDGDIEQLALGTRRRKGVMGTIGAPQMMEYCRALEASGKRNDLAVAKQ